MRQGSVFGTIAIFFAAGCASGEVDLGDVHGIVTVDGQPLGGALVQFLPQGGGRSSQGRTDPDGSYQLSYTARDTGALVGESKVMITTGNLEDPKHRDETLPLKYNYESTLTADVKSGSNEINFPLDSK